LKIYEVYLSEEQRNTSKRNSMGNLVGGLTSNIAAAQARNATNAPTNVPNTNTTPNNNSNTQTVPNPPVTSVTPAVVTATGTSYKPKESKEPSSVITERFRLLLEKRDQTKTKDEIITDYKRILVREIPKPTNTMAFWIVFSIILFIAMGVAVYYYQNNIEDEVKTKRKKKDKEVKKSETVEKNTEKKSNPKKSEKQASVQTKKEDKKVNKKPEDRKTETKKEDRKVETKKEDKKLDGKKENKDNRKPTNKLKASIKAQEALGTV
jgi:hypothetical protein